MHVDLTGTGRIADPGTDLDPHTARIGGAASLYLVDLKQALQTIDRCRTEIDILGGRYRHHTSAVEIQVVAIINLDGLDGWALTPLEGNGERHPFVAQAVLPGEGQYLSRNLSDPIVFSGRRGIGRSAVDSY